LDLRLEQTNAERFAEDFAADTRGRAPGSITTKSSASGLTMEDVSYIRIDNLTGWARVGITPRPSAQIYDVYLTQFFETYRIHATASG